MTNKIKKLLERWAEYHHVNLLHLEEIETENRLDGLSWFDMKEMAKFIRKETIKNHHEYCDCDSPIKDMRAYKEAKKKIIKRIKKIIEPWKGEPLAIGEMLLEDIKNVK